MSVLERSPEANFDDPQGEVSRFREAVRKFAREEIAPRALELDQQAHDHFAWDLVQEGHQLGLTRAMLPPHHGGLGLGVVGVCLAMEELAAACPGVALIFGATMLGQAPVLLSGDSRLQSRFLPLFSGDEAVLACNAVCEEEAGTDLVIPQSTRHARNVSTIHREGAEYVLNGHKRVITNAAVATFASVFVTLEGTSPESGLTCVMVPLDTSGITRGPVADMARSSVAAVSTGIARHALETAVEFCGQRVQGGAPLRAHQMTARKLAEMTSKVDAARLLYLHSANKVDNELPAPEYEPAVAKLFADRIAIEVAGDAVSLMGSRGFIREFGLEKVLRDSYGARIYEGTPEALALAITDCLYREDSDDDDDL